MSSCASERVTFDAGFAGSFSNRFHKQEKSKLAWLCAVLCACECVRVRMRVPVRVRVRVHVRVRVRVRVRLLVEKIQRCCCGN